MTILALGCFVAFGAAAVTDWAAVASGHKTVEYAAKPTALAFLILAAIFLDPDRTTVRWWFVAALSLSLAGDVFLMLPTDRFVHGLASFLAAHVAFIVGFWVAGTETALFVGAAILVGVMAVWVGSRVVTGARSHDRRLAVPVSVYTGVLGAMVAFAVGSQNALAAVGAALFMLSDSLIGWNRFVRSLSWAPVAIIVTYHLAQAALVASLI